MGLETAPGSVGDASLETGPGSVGGVLGVPIRRNFGMTYEARRESS